MKHLIWMFFKNDEDGCYGVGTKFNPDGKKNPWIAIQWWFRNPAHNFTHHVIGFWGKEFESVIVQDHNPGLSKSYRVYKDKKYPYWNYRKNDWQSYIGWRSSGAFGISFRSRKNS